MFDSPASRMLQSVQSSAQPATQQWLQPPSTSSTQTNPQQPTPPAAESLPVQVSDQQKLDTFESVLSEMEAEKLTTAPVVEDPQPQIQQPQPAEPPSPVGYSSTVSKEQGPGLTNSVELPGGMQYIESEPKPEISAEVEAYLQKVEEDTSHLPHEIVIAAEQHAAASQPRNLPQDVKVLPITAAQAEAGKKKNTTFSIRWLVAFSEKLAEMLKGKAVYRNE